jgi:hypothetical protein
MGDDPSAKVSMKGCVMRFALSRSSHLAVLRSSHTGVSNVTMRANEYPGLLPRHEPLARPDSVLLRAAEIVRERGLSQGPWRPGGPLCAAGAVGQAGEELGLTRSEMEAHLLRFAGALGGSAFSEVHGWNDAPGRTATQVAEALERAAYGL